MKDIERIQHNVDAIFKQDLVTIDAMDTKHGYLFDNKQDDNDYGRYTTTITFTIGGCSREVEDFSHCVRKNDTGVIDEAINEAEDMLMRRIADIMIGTIQMKEREEAFKAA